MSEVREEGVSEEGADAGVKGVPVTGHDDNRSMMFDDEESMLERTSRWQLSSTY